MAASSCSPGKEVFSDNICTLFRKDLATILLSQLCLPEADVTCFCFHWRHSKLEAALAEINWRVRWDDIMFGAMEKKKLERSGSRMSLTRVGAWCQKKNIRGMLFMIPESIFPNKLAVANNCVWLLYMSFDNENHVRIHTHEFLRLLVCHRWHQHEYHGG